MEGYMCKKCNSNSFFMNQNGPHIELRCNDCGAFIKNLTKKEVVILQHQEEETKKTEQQIHMAKLVDYASEIKSHCMKHQARHGCNGCFFSHPDITCLLDINTLPSEWDIEKAKANIK